MNITITEATARTTLDIRVEQHDPPARQEAELVLPQDAVVSGFAYEGPGDLASAQVLANQESGPQLQPTGRPHQGPGPGGVRWV